jgi:DNA-binding NarL/FixJ family response regulator
VRVALERDHFVVCAEVGDAKAAVDAALRERPDVCLIDIHMPGNGIRAAHEIGSRLEETAVVMLTVSRNDADLFAALRAGAAGYLLKDAKPDDITMAVEGAVDGASRAGETA